MKVWTKVKINQKNKDIESLTKSYINYILNDTSIEKLQEKYQIEQQEIDLIYQELASRIAGLLILYIGKDHRRLKEIYKKYQINPEKFVSFTPELEGYVEK